MRTQRSMFRAAAVAGALGVMLGAFGAHGLESRLDADALAVWHTAVLYHLFHALALLALAATAGQRDAAQIPGEQVFTRTIWITRAAWAFVIGLVLFSGSLYLLALTGLSWLGAITPLGGMAFIIGWALLWPAARA